MIIRVILLTVFVLIVVTGAILAQSPIKLISISAQDLLQVITPLFFVSLIVERLMAYLLQAWRGRASDYFHLKIADLTELLSKDKKRDPEIRDELINLRMKRAKYDHVTQMIKNWVSLFAGITISAIGIRAIDPLVESASLEGLSDIRQKLYHMTDIVLTGVLISGGTTIIDSITSTLSGMASRARESRSGSAVSKANKKPDKRCLDSRFPFGDLRLHGNDKPIL